ncbi:hypothetical protein GGH97_003122 [Coemansia sp. RSA 475]|nr:hypothetical protein GGH97_003122 [Coemansia sp. RSA 475]
MTEGGIARWEKQEGEAFVAGDLLLQIETDKAQMDVEAQDDGVLVKILAPEGAQNVRVNSQVKVEGNGVGVVTDGSKVAEVAGAASASVLDLAQAIKQARSGPASGRPAAVLAGENVFTPDTLPDAAVVGVGAPYASVSAAEASAAMDSALNDLLGVSTSSAQPSKQASTVIDVRVISNSPTVASALAAKIKGFLSNPELLTF